MDTSKLYETCDIKRRTTSVTAGEESFAESVVFAGIKCYIREMKANTSPTTVEQSNVQTVLVTIDKGYAIQVGDIVVSSSIRYKVEQVKAYGLIQNANTRLKCTRI